MKGTIDNSESDSQQDAELQALNAADAEKTQSGTVTFVPAQTQQFGSVDEKDQTIISQRPVAAPEEF